MAADPASAHRGKCPICARSTLDAYRPFCSRRCADVDLARWLRGGYAIPGESEDGQEKPAAAPPPNGTGKHD
jgi:endogenous inhibitor of DNA gyrase (YacG/DUF329 family)